MEIREALCALGVDRVIWIDDYFNETPGQLADLLCNSIEIALACSIDELQLALEQYSFDESESRILVEQILTDAGPERCAEIKKIYFAQEKTQESIETDEISAESFKAVYELMDIKAHDRWTFKGYEKKIEAVCEAGDSKISYIIDLRDGHENPFRGLEVLACLQSLKSKGTAFILTHETTEDGEASLETLLLSKLRESTPRSEIPICVIAKQRLISDSDDDLIIHNALKVAIKRAGLRRSMHEVLQRAAQDVMSAFIMASDQLLEIPPEQLEAFVMERARREGVSELHVVERAITVTMAHKIREVFATDQLIQISTDRLRSLRNVKLETPSSEIHEHLQNFRMLEVWESDSLVNSSYTPIACGDVFEFDMLEFPASAEKKRFLLLAQPCDIAIREKGTRALETAFLVPLKAKDTPQVSKTKLKESPLQFKLDGIQFACDLRAATSVKLSILDLASCRQDGRVRLDKDQSFPPQMLPGLKVAITQSVKPVKVALDSIAGQQGALKGKTTSASQLSDKVDISLQLAMPGQKSFKKIQQGEFKKSNVVNMAGEKTQLPERITWNLRRAGRIKMPYAASLLKDYMSVMSREAFDLDFTWVDQADAE